MSVKLHIQKSIRHYRIVLIQIPLKTGWITGVVNIRELIGFLILKAATKWQKALNKSKCFAGR